MSRDEVGAVERAFQVLGYLSREEASLSELSRRLGVVKSAALRLLTTLERNGAVVRDPSTQAYRLGPRLLELGSTYLRGLDLRRAAWPHMHALWHETRETVTLVALIGRQSVCVDNLDSPHELRPVAEVGREVGSIAPPTRGAIGKVLLAFAGADVKDEVLRDMEGDGAAFREELDDIVRAGVWLSVGERIAGLWAVAGPIMDHTGAAVAALSVRGPALRFQPEVVAGHVNSLRAATAGISRDLGAPPRAAPAPEAAALLRRRIQAVARLCRRYGAP